MFAAFGRSFLDLLREQRCAACGTPVQRHARSGPVLCSYCASVLERRAAGFCLRCGDIMEWPEQRPSVCGQCLKADPPWDKFFFHGVYTGHLRELLLRLKNGRELSLACALGSMLAWHPGLVPAYDAIVPVPMHTRRLRERGFNQAQEIARPVAEFLDTPLVPRLLGRPVAAPPQTGLNHEERRRNLQGVFAAAQEARGLNILLIDDVATTCATMEKAAAALLESGAAAVDAAVVARTPLWTD